MCTWLISLNENPSIKTWQDLLFIDSRVINQLISYIIHIFTEYLAELFFPFVI